MDPITYALLMTGASFFLALIWGAPLIRISSLSGENPTRPAGSGWLLILIPVALITLLANLNRRESSGLINPLDLFPIGVMVCFGALGVFSARVGSNTKSRILAASLHVGLALLVGIPLYTYFNLPDLYLPFYRGEFDLGFWYLPVAVTVILLAVQAVQQTASIDGLTGLVTATGFAAFGAVAAVQQESHLTRMSFTIVGAVLGFLWFNMKPASLALNRSGTFMLGSGMAVIALMTGQWPLLLLILVVPFAELITFAVQAGFSRLAAVPLMTQDAPLHRYFALSGWSETQILQRFWVINLLFAVIGITLALV